MLSPRGGRCLRQLTVPSSTVGCLPAFLLPAFSSSPSFRPFSTSTPCASRVGGATLSLPPEVNMTILAPPTPKNKNRVSRTEPVSTVQVEGPLGTNPSTRFKGQNLTVYTGKMSMQLPPFMGIDHDATARKAFLKVQDPEIRRQREMWGAQRIYTMWNIASANGIQAPLAPTSRIISSASQKAIPPFFVWSVSGTEPRSSQAPSPCHRNTRVKSSSRSRLDIRIPSSWACRRALRLVRHNRLVFSWKGWTRRWSISLPPRSGCGGSPSPTRARGFSSTGRRSS